MKVTAITIRAGNVLEQDGKLWVVLKSEIYQPGKGASVVQVEMRDLRSGTKTNVRFRTQETVEKVRIDEYDYNFLFADAEGFTFMSQESFEQITVSKEIVGEPGAFLQDGMVCSISTYEGQALSVRLPETVVMLVAEADPVVKGQTASSSYKPAVLENGVRILVPPFLEAGEKIVVRTADATYVERAKK
ncbi:MAG: elongation factor P [Alphaproteobacteria bacterium]